MANIETQAPELVEKVVAITEFPRPLRADVL